MATKKKMLQAAAGNAGGAGGAALDITDVFSTYLYEGKGGAQVIQNGIKLGDLKEADDGVYYLSSPSSVIGNNSAGNTVTATLDGNVTRDGVTTKFASSSYNFDGASNIRLSRALIDTSSSFCFETWVYFDSTGVSNDMAMLLAQYKSGENGRLLFGAQSGNLVVRYNGSTVALTAPVSASQWHHVAWSYDGTTHRLFVDGTLEDSTTTDFPIYTGVTTQLGGTDSTLLNNYDLDGRMEDIRITTGDARYTSSFTPPTASLPVTTAATVLEAGEGGLVWVKDRSFASDHGLFDTERGKDERLRSNTTNASTTNVGWITSFNSNGFGVGSSNSSSGSDYASWTFRKAPKFFTCVTWSGNGTNGREIAHNLGTTPACIIIKNTNSSEHWQVWHKDGGGSGTSASGQLNQTNAFSESNTKYYFGNGTNKIDPTSTVFTVHGGSTTNGSGGTYVAYLFAHNDGDGGFGPDGDQDIIKCGSYTGGGSSDVDVDLGFEPQFVLVKGADIARGWVMGDIMRGAPVGSNGQRLFANTSDAETTEDTVFTPTPTGFKVKANTGGTVNDSGLDYIYIAIRRGPLAPPESGTEVFAPVFHNDDTSEINVSGGFTADAFISKRRSGTETYMTPRLLGGQTLRPSSTAAEVGYSNFVAWDTQEGVNFTGWWGSVTDGIDWQFKRAPGFFDVVAYSGNGTAGRTVSHNLGVAPEMIWIKSRNQTYLWPVYHKDLGNNKFLHLEDRDAETTLSSFLNSTTPTETDITLGNWISVNGSGNNYIAYLFATVPGVSKVGSYTGNGTSQTIDCGFTSGARFVLIKETSGTGDWYVWDSERGITASSDPYLKLNTTDAESTTYDGVSTSPSSVGFSVEQVQYTVPINRTNNNYIFYAIA